MEADFPAAHSMDSTWFAVDKDGYVACFDTGEAGAMPERASDGQAEGYEILQYLATQFPQQPPIHDPHGQEMPGRGSRDGGRHLMGAIGGGALMFLRTADPLQAEITAGNARVFPASEGVAVVVREMTEALFERLHKGGHCQGCSWHFHFDDEEDAGSDPASLGLYYYRHITDNWVAGPYGRVRLPVQPIHVDQLPPGLRQALKEIRFEKLRFADTPRMQPVEHVPCTAWDAAWLDVDGKKVRPLPGREADYDPENYKELGEDGIQVEPPTEIPG